MKTCRICNGQKALDLFKKHSTALDGRANICKSCDSKRSVENQRKNREHRKAYMKDWLGRNPEAAKRYDEGRARWQKENPERIREARERHRAKPEIREKELQYSREYNRKNSELKTQKKLEWMKKNPDRVNAATRRRNAAKLNAVPVWADAEAIAQLYTKAKEFEGRFGGSWEVDHIVPLQNKLVCGLHVQDNLQLLTREENIFKNNRFWPDMP